MSEQINTPTSSTRIRKRKQGKRLTKKERKLAQEAFLEVYANCANIRLACEAVGIDRSTFYQWCEHDEEFSMAYRLKEPEANDLLIAEAWRRGVHGVEEPLVSMGQVVYDYEPVLDENGEPKLDSKGKPIMRRNKALSVRKYSDTLLIMLIKAKMPEYRDKQQVTVDGSLTIATEWGGGALDEEEVADAHNRS